MPKVSVVTGYYNRSSVLERTIESILTQTLDDFELIVFDDCSQDGTAEKLAALETRYADPRFKYLIHKENKGFVRGLRDAIAQSSGEYVAIQGSGDVSLPRRLELQAALLDERPGVGAVGSWYNNVLEADGTKRLRRPNADLAGFEDLLQANVFSHGEVMIRRSTLDAVGGYRPVFTFSQDRDLWLRISKVAQLATVPEPLYDRYVQFDGVSYIPAKIVRQACFGTAAVRLAQLSESAEAAALARMETDGPEAVADHTDPIVQRKLVPAVARMAFFGAPSGAEELAREYITHPIRRFALIALSRVFGSRLLGPVRPVLRRAAGIKAGD